ncbi:MAG: UDP-3-O-(3-hydroxymyristoyl)glucosamine N-acyltransferase [Alcanivoracaceae bacterium]|jgi:UDP-3-O-[3-hydroxymyristoyl] glucosamine N-acyltransferase|nr:UDP-3-O-(3-hydroxymyristoyl)glucosamine N-acyltransferase [Alcanivoracaceae bacterium]
MMTLAEIAELLKAELRGDPSVQVSGLGTLKGANSGQISFLTNPRYRAQLKETRAAAVICRAEHADESPVPVLVVSDPHLAFAVISQRFDIAPVAVAGVHPRAIVDPSAQIDESASIAAGVVVEANAEIGAGVVVMANSVIGVGARLAEQVRIGANVTICHGAQIGARTNIQAGSVIGCDGFGFAFNGQGWTKIAQVGTVRIGESCDIGAGVTIDRGAIEDTVIGNNVIIDNQVHIAHNVTIGEGTAMAAQVGVAGSSQIGRFCVFAGQVGVAGHIEIVDQVQVMGKSMVSGSIRKKGIYASGVPETDHETWRRNAVRFRHLDEMAKRLKAVERRLDDSNPAK